MAESKIRSLPEKDALDQIVETVQQAESGAAPFALVLGSGFSHGLVPTVRQLVEETCAAVGGVLQTQGTL